jgi:hypothetical protein
MTIKYSIQPSTLIPDGQTAPHGRYQVHLQDEETIITVDSTHATIADLLKISASVVLVGSDNQPIGTLMPTLKGGFPLAESPTPTADNVSVGFRPSSTLYEATRQSVSFERVDSVMRNPVITLVSDWYQNERVDGIISVNGGHSNYVEIKGNHFKVGETLTVTLTEIGGSATAVQLANQYGLIKWTDRLIAFNTKVALITPTATGTLTVDIDGKIASVVVTITDRT